MFNPLDQSFPNEANSLFEAMRRHNPIWTERRQGETIHHAFTYDACREVMSNYDLWSSDIPLFKKTLLGDADLLIQSDPPAHTALRQAITPWVNSRIRSVRNQMTSTIREGFILFQPGRLDAVDWSEATKRRIIANFFGFSDRVIEQIEGWNHRFSPAVGAEFLEFSGPRIEKQEKEVAELHLQLDDILCQAAGEHNPILVALRDAIIQALGSNLPFYPLLKTLVFGSGHTLSTQICNAIGIWVGLSDGEISEFRSMDEVDGIVNEIFRIKSVFRGSHRIASCDFKFDDISVKQGDYCIVWTTSANHDQTVFEQGQGFRPKASNARNLGFGSGVHRCIGMPLAKDCLGALVLALQKLECRGKVLASKQIMDPWVDGYEQLELELVGSESL